MRQLALTRQNRSGIRQKAKWALYQEDQLRRLIEDITDLVNDLETLFPATQTQRELANTEVLTIGDTEGIATLKEIAAEQDKMLEQAIIKASDNAGNTTYSIVVSGNVNGEIQVGYSSGTIVFGRGA